MFTSFQITPDWALAVYVAIASLLFDYFPWLAAWFDALTVEKKRLITLAAAVVIVLGAFAGSCLGWWITNLTCEFTSIARVILDLILAVAVMYGFHQGTKPTGAMKSAMFRTSRAKITKVIHRK